MVFRENQRIRRWLYYHAADWAMRSAVMSTLACVVSVPLVACHFGLFSPYAVPLSILLVEPSPGRRRLMVPLTVLGAVVGALAALGIFLVAIMKS